MFWIIRWTNRQGQDESIVVEAKSRVVAETIALKRDIPVVVIEEASDEDVLDAKVTKRLWQYTSKSARHTCFGQPVAGRQLACLIFCGIWTIGVLLQCHGIIPAFIRLPM
jgi:hypothetical protein